MAGWGAMDMTLLLWLRADCLSERSARAPQS
jgi:hypothetical protein